jgi:DNA-binding MarR family transcriptional regulator
MKLKLTEFEKTMLSPLQIEILEVIHEQPPGFISRMELEKMIIRPRTTMSDNLKRLIQYGYLKKFVGHNGKPGRDPTYYKIIDRSQL